MTRLGPLAATLLLAACGTATLPADMPARSWKYYAAHPDDIAPMQAICRQWAGSRAPAASEPAVVVSNCSNAAYARARLKTMR